MIENIACRDTQALFKGRRLKRWQDIKNVAPRKLDMIDAARAVQDLRQPPGNRLELLRGDRRGTYSIRINDQWRICFGWSGDNAVDVEIVDYH